MAKDRVVADTSAFMGSLDAMKECFNDYTWVLTSIVAEELDNLSKSDNGNKSFNARQALRFIEEKEDEFEFFVNDVRSNAIPKGWDKEKNDNLIILMARELKAKITGIDRALISKAKMLGIEVLQLKNKYKTLDNYTGVKEKYLDPNDEKDAELLSAIHEGRETLDTIHGEYLICWDKTTGKTLAELKNKDGVLTRISCKDIESKLIGKTKPINVKQRLAFDLLQDKEVYVKMISGGFGTGKTLLATAYAMQELEKGNYAKIIYLRNNHEVKDTKEIGFLPNGEFDKLLPFALPFCDKIGGVDELESLVSKNMVEVVHMGFLRGREFENSIMLVTESQNLTEEHVKLILGRLGKGSIVIFDGDLQQVDNKIFQSSNGLVLMSNGLKGDKRYGQVVLDKVERSEVARLAEKLSDFSKGK